MTGLKGRNPEGILKGWEKCNRKNDSTAASILGHQSSSGQETGVARGHRHGRAEKSDRNEGNRR